MEVVHVDTCPYDLNKLLKCVPPFRKPSFVRGQIARDEVLKRKGTRPGEGTKIPAATQISRRVNLSRLAEIWVATRSEFCSRTMAVTTIAICLGVDDIAAQSHQRPIFPCQIQRDRGYGETNFDSGLGVVIVGVSAGWFDRHPRKENRNEQSDDSSNFCIRR